MDGKAHEFGADQLAGIGVPAAVRDRVSELILMTASHVVPPGDPFRLAEAIRACHEGKHDLEEMGHRARAYAEQETDRSIAVDRYRAVLEEVRGQC